MIILWEIWIENNSGGTQIKETLASPVKQSENQGEFMMLKWYIGGVWGCGLENAVALKNEIRFNPSFEK